MSLTKIDPSEIKKAYERIAPFIIKTPVLQSDLINEKLGGKVFFKFEGFQKTGAFKLRGALNTLLTLKEQNKLPAKVVAFSSGNHSQAVAYASKLLGVQCTIFIPEFASQYKINATKAYGVEVILTKTRQEAEAGAREMEAQGAYCIAPYDNDYVIAGQGTSCYEALMDGIKPDAIFATVGGGGWISGTYLAAQLLSPRSIVIAGEPKIGNDASQSFRSGKIFKFTETPMTIADGARTLAIAERTFQYIKNLADIIEVEDNQMLDWCRLLALNLKITAEPTSAVAASACATWLSNKENHGKTVLVLLSGGNIDAETHRAIWK